MLTVGGEVRRDAIGAVGAYRTASRQRISTVRDDAVGQTSGAAYAEAQTQWSTVVRTTIGIRGDLYGWDVETDDPLNGGTASDGIVNPKFSVAFGPWRRTELYASAGGGFHSNDGRGATIHRDPVSGDPVDPVDPLIRARGAEVGLRTLALPRVHTTLAVWVLWLDSELLFIGDAGSLMRAALDVVVPYLHERRQFGAPIGEFQLMQAKLADLYAGFNSSRAYSYAVARACDAGQTTRFDAAACLMLASENGVKSGLEAVQALGGNGYINDYSAGRLLRDAKLYDIGAGTNENRRMLIGRELFRATD